MTLTPSVPYSYCNAYDVTVVDVQLYDPEIIVPSLLVILERFTKADERTTYSPVVQQDKTDESE